jgi:two-component system chemotaxis response regulator CheB
VAENGVNQTGPIGLAVVGASAGGVEALKALAAGLPADLGCPVVVVLHLPSTGTSVLPAILERAGALPASAARDGDELKSGHFYVAPPDCHVLVTPEGLRLSGGPRENGVRPAVDPTMRSAAEFYDGSTVGIVLSGTRDDGAAGLAAIKARGGRALVQDPAEALYDGMPRSAMARVSLDAVLPVAAIARWLAAAARGAPPDDAPTPADPPPPVSFQGDGPSDEGTRFTCPDCGGGIYEVCENGITRLRCSVGHVYSPESFAAEHGRELERALWTATRTLDDRVVLLERLAARARSSDQRRTAERYEREAHAARDHAAVIRGSMQQFDDIAATAS